MVLKVEGDIFIFFLFELILFYSFKSGLRIFYSQHAILIAGKHSVTSVNELLLNNIKWFFFFFGKGGIGITPFASILQALASRYLKKCPNCCSEFYDDIEKKKLKKVLKIKTDKFLF